ncbi:MAG: SPFH domain-containing protein [Smithella sp.]
MFGIKFIKIDPSVYVMVYKKGKIRREGNGLAFFFFAPTTSLVAVPVASRDIPFIFEEVTADFQEVTIQGQVAFRVDDPQKLCSLLNFTLNEQGEDYVSDDPENFPQRIINLVQVFVRTELQRLSLKEALGDSGEFVRKVLESLTTADTVKMLGVKILNLSILAIKPNPETARALEAEIREQLLRESDEAVYARRNSAIEQERSIKENELNTEIAVENKRRQIRETQMDAERAVQEKRRLLAAEEMAGKISLEEKNGELVQLKVQNARDEADAKAYGLSAVMEVLKNIDPKIINALASRGMGADQLIALAFREIADGAAKIGELNISPELLQSLTKAK